MSAFTGVPEAALDFYDDLEMDNTKSFWAAHKDLYEASGPRLARIRSAIADPRGAQLEAVLAALAAAGWERGGDRLKTSPRGYDPTHPRIDLLRHRSLTVARPYGFDPVIHTPALLDRVRDDWRAVSPLVQWVCDNAGD